MQTCPNDERGPLFEYDQAAYNLEKSANHKTLKPQRGPLFENDPEACTGTWTTKRQALKPGAGSCSTTTEKRDSSRRRCPK